MQLYELEWGWKFNIILSILVLFICSITFDMINNWENKKRSDMMVLFIGITMYVSVILAVTSPNVITLLSVFSLVVLCIAASVGVSNDFNDKSAPWELWLIAILSGMGLFIAVVWAYFKTEIGRILSKRFHKAGIYAKDQFHKAKDEYNNLKDKPWSMNYDNWS